jgi:DNA-directed RNA polymerase specialized sigma24 family protein
VYLRNVDVLMGYFARRCREPQTVADLTSETFVRAMNGFAGFDPRRGSDRAWLFGIAAHVFAHHCQQSAGDRDAVARLGGHRALDEDEIEELAARIDAEREGAALMQRYAGCPRSSGRRSSSSTWRGSPRRRRHWPSASPVSHSVNGCPGRGPG